MPTSTNESQPVKKAPPRKVVRGGEVDPKTGISDPITIDLETGKPMGNARREKQLPYLHDPTPGQLPDQTWTIFILPKFLRRGLK